MALRMYQVVSKSQADAECILYIISFKPIALGQADSWVQMLAVVTF